MVLTSIPLFTFLLPILKQNFEKVKKYDTKCSKEFLDTFQKH